MTKKTSNLTLGVSISLIAILISLNSNAQSGKMYLAEINSDSGTVKNAFVLPGVKGVIMEPTPGLILDPNKRLLYFHGLDKNFNEQNYSIGIDSGKVHSYSLPDFSNTMKVVSMKYDNLNKKIIASLQSNQYKSLADYEVENSQLNNLRGFWTAQTNSLLETDEQGHWIQFDNNNQILLGNLSDGKIIGSKVLYITFNKYTGVAYDRILKCNYYTVYQNSGNYFEMYKAVFSKDTTPIIAFQLPELRTIWYQTYDYKNSLAYFFGITKNYQQALIKVNMQTGKVLSEVEFNYYKNPDNYIKGLVLDSATGKLYGLHWESNSAIKQETVKNCLYQVFPNPFTSSLTIQAYKNIGLFKFKLLDVSGRTVFNSDLNELESKTFDLNELQAGVYILNVTSKEGTTFSKIIKE